MSQRPTDTQPLRAAAAHRHGHDERGQYGAHAGAGGRSVADRAANFRQGAPFNVASRRPDRNPDHLRLVRTMASDVTMTAAVRERLIGDLATDTVLARPVRTIALYHVSDMVKAIRASGATVLRGVDTVTGCLYTGWRRNDTPRPDFAWASELANAISEEDAAELYFVDRYTGSLSHLARTND